MPNAKSGFNGTSGEAAKQGGVPVSAAKTKKKPFLIERAITIFRQRPTLPLRRQSSTIGAGKLNFRVRDGNGCFLSAIVTEKSTLLILFDSVFNK